MQRTPEELRSKLLRLVRDENVTARAAARACGLSERTAGRILAESDSPIVSAAGTIPSQGQLPLFSGPETPTASGPFNGQQPVANVPKYECRNDQPAPPQYRPFDPGYHGRSFRSFSAPLAFDGWDLDRVRGALSLHRIGNFLESSTLALIVMGFPPIMTALSQRIYPILSLPRHVRAGSRGFSRVLGLDIEQQLTPRAGLYPSNVFPSTLFGATAIDLAMMGFCVWQHVFGDPDPDTGIRPLYTRRWPTWAVQYYRWRRTYVAITDSGPVDICDDGKFTLVAAQEEPHFFGASLALAEEALDGTCTRNARASWIDRYGSPKWVATMPQGTGSDSPEGRAMMDALYMLRGPDGYGVLPYGASLDVKSLSASQSTVLNDALASNWRNVASVLLGSDGTVSQGTGVYSSPLFKYVARGVVDKDLQTILRGVNGGHIGTYCRYNFAATIEESRGEWIQPVADIPLPDPDADARIASYATRVKSFHEIVKLKSENGCVIDDERIRQLASSLEIDPPTLAEAPEMVPGAAETSAESAAGSTAESPNANPDDEANPPSLPGPNESASEVTQQSAPGDEPSNLQE